MVKDTNEDKSQEPSKPTSRDMAKKRARKIKNTSARKRQVEALKSGKARRKVKKNL